MTMTRRVVISSWNTMTLDLSFSFLMLRRSEFSVEEFNFGRSNFNVSEEAAKIELTLSEIPRNRQPVAWRFQIPPNFCQSWELQPQKRPCFAFHGEIGSTTRDVNVGFTSQINHHLISLSYQTLEEKKKDRSNRSPGAKSCCRFTSKDTDARIRCSFPFLDKWQGWMVPSSKIRLWIIVFTDLFASFW